METIWFGGIEKEDAKRLLNGQVLHPTKLIILGK